jgi:hypothetical protein
MTLHTQAAPPLHLTFSYDYDIIWVSKSVLYQVGNTPDSTVMTVSSAPESAYVLRPAESALFKKSVSKLWGSSPNCPGIAGAWEPTVRSRRRPDGCSGFVAAAWCMQYVHCPAVHARGDRCLADASKKLCVDCASYRAHGGRAH